MNLIYFATVSTIECFVRRSAISGLILIAPCILMINFFKILLRHDFFFKFPLCICIYVNHGHKFLIKAQFMTDNVHEKGDPVRFYYGFRIKLPVFMALTNCFRKYFMELLHFVFICYDFCSSMNYRPQS